MRIRVVAALLLAAFIVAIPARVNAWGFGAHKYIMGRALALLPPELRPFFEANRAYVVERTIDPDLWRTIGWEAESPRHFVDMDAYGPYPFKDLPHDYDEAVSKFGKEMVDRNGTLPWRTEEIYRKLVDAFQQKTAYSRDNVKLFAAVMTHYVADAHVPLHSASNHDGQLTQQWGIHSRWEAELFERYRNRLIVRPRPVVPVASARELMFESLTSSFTYVQPLLDADREATVGRDTYDDGYFAMVFGKTRPMLETRLAQSITDAASLITAAWVEAGRPAVPVKAPSRPPRPIRRQ